MKEYIDKLKEIETLVELSIGTTMTEEKAIDIYAVTNDLMCKVKKLNIPVVMQRSEQLFAFLEYCDNVGWIKNVDKKRIIEDYQKANNCA